VIAAMPVSLAVPELSFSAGLPGFAEARRFALVRVEGVAEPFSVLRSLDEPGLEFVVVPAAPFFPDYAPELSDDVADELGLTSSEDALVLLILTIDADQGAVTANLAGPVVVNVRSGAAQQVVLVGQEQALREPLPPAVS
jgi:flagellar assembly factor FliW